MGQKQDKVKEYIIWLMYMAGINWCQVLNDFTHTLQVYFTGAAWAVWVNISHESKWMHDMTTTKLYANSIFVMSHTCHGVSDSMQLSWLFRSLFRIIKKRIQSSALLILVTNYWQSANDLERFSMAWYHHVFGCTVCASYHLFFPLSYLPSIPFTCDNPADNDLGTIIFKSSSVIEHLEARRWLITGARCAGWCQR